MWPELLTIPLPQSLAEGGGWGLPSFLLAFTLALVLAWLEGRRATERRGLPPGDVGPAICLGLPIFWMGSRAAWALGEGRSLMASSGGLDYWGGLGFVALVFGLILRLRGRPLGPSADVAASALTAALVPLRLGSLLDGGYTGLPMAADHPLAIRFSTAVTGGSFLGWETPPGLPHHAGNASGLPLHPTALYAALGFLAVHLVLRLRRPRRGQEGGDAALALLGCGAVSCVVGQWRGDHAPDWGGLSRVQIEALAAALLGLFLWLLLRVRGRNALR